MAGRAKRKLQDLDPTKSDSEDLDYGAESSSRPRPQARSARGAKSHSRKPPKRSRKERYGDSEDDNDSNSDEISDQEEASFAEDSEREEQVELNPRTGRSVRTVAKKPVKYEEPSDDDIEASESDRDLVLPTPRSKKRSGVPQPRERRSLIVKLKVSLSKTMEGVGKRSRTGSKDMAKREPTPNLTGTRRSSRISHDEVEPLVALTDSGRHAQVARVSTATPEPPLSRRPTRGSKGLKKPPSTIMEASQEDSTVEQGQAGDEEVLSQLHEAAAAGDDAIVVRSSRVGGDTQMDLSAGAAEDDEDIQMEEAIVQESMEDNEDDDEVPVARGGRTLRLRRKGSTPPTSQPPKGGSRRSLRSRKPGMEQSSDFEPEGDAQADVEENVSSSDDLSKPSRVRSRDDSSNGPAGRRSRRLAPKIRASQRSRASRHHSEDEVEEELDPEEIADEAADLEEDHRRNKRTRKRPAQQIAFETNLRNRSKRIDYRILRPELALHVDDDDGPTAAVTPQRTRRGGGGAAYRSLFSTFGPFGGAGGPPPILGGPEGMGAAGEVDSDSSDDEMAARPAQNFGGTVGMTPTSAAAHRPLFPQAQHNEATSGAGGGPVNLGKVKDRKALADADPLGVDPNVTFDGVGGLDDHIDRLKEMVALPLLYPEVFQRFHVTPPRGVLFHGPPGTGKTLLARALASSVSSQGQKVTFYMRKGADALSKWVGEAEKQLRLLFEEARKNQPSIIFFDEIDGLAPVRSSKQEQIHASIVATLLALMDGMDGRGQVIVIGATNRPDSVDPALRRPGRFDREFYFPLPNVAARRAIIDIHTKGWDPPLAHDFKDQLAEITRGYGGADLRALCTEAALNAVQGTYPQIYSSDEKLIIDPSTIKVLAKDFMISVNKMTPSSERSASSGAAPLKKDVEPLLRKPLAVVSKVIEDVIPQKRKVTALEEAMYDDRDDENGFAKETMQRQFESSRIFRPRLLIKGSQGMGQQYLGAALLSKFEGLHVQSFDLATLMKDSTRSPEAAVVQLFEEVKRHKPSVIYIPNVNLWYRTLSDSAIRTFTSLLRSLPPTDPVLLLGILELAHNEEPDKDMLRDLFGYSQKNQYVLERPNEEARSEYFQSLIAFMQQAPSEFPEPANRKKRKLESLPVAPAPAEKISEPNRAELKAQKKHDRNTLNMLKLQIQQVMDQIKMRYKKFRTPIVEDNVISYLYDEQNPEMLTTDLAEAERQQQLFRPYELDKDKKGVIGLREVASGKFYYNNEIVTIEKRLSNGYYKRPKDFEVDIKRLTKDAKTSGDTDRSLKANEMFANVEVDMTGLEWSHPALTAECDAVYEREQARERGRLAKVQEAARAGEEVPRIMPNVPPPHASTTTTETSGPVRLGEEVPGRRPLLQFPITPSRMPGPSPTSNGYSITNGSHQSNQTNGSTVPSRPQEDSEMIDSEHEFAPPQDRPALHPTIMPSQPNTQGQRSQKSAHTQLVAGSQLDQYHNSASTTTSGQKTSDHSHRSSGLHTERSNGVHDYPDISALPPVTGGSELPDTQEMKYPSWQSQPDSAPSSWQASQPMAPPSRLPTSINALLNNPSEPTDRNDMPQPPNQSQIVIDEDAFRNLHVELARKSSGLSLEQLEQVNARLMDVVWKTRGDWNRNHVYKEVMEAFNETVKDIEICQKVLGPSQNL